MRTAAQGSRRGCSGYCGYFQAADGRFLQAGGRSRGSAERYSNLAVMWSQLELVKYNVPAIMKDMQKPYLVITGENAWSRSAWEDVYNAVPGNKEMHVILEAFAFILPFFALHLGKAA